MICASYVEVWRARRDTMESVVGTAAALGALVLAASLLSSRFRVSVAVIEVALGVLAGNAFHLRASEWLDLLAAFGATALVFLAGTETDPAVLRSRWRESLLVGGLSFIGPFVLTLFVASVLLGWDLRQSEIAACAMSGTSLAVVFVTLIESGT